MYSACVAIAPRNSNANGSSFARRDVYGAN